jgi:prolyl-tRNA synthetase
MNMHISDSLRDGAEKIYQALQDVGVDVLFDDRKVRAGFMFSDMELIGIPHRIVIGDRGLDAGIAEYKARTDKETQDIPLSDIVEFVKLKLKNS